MVGHLPGGDDWGTTEKVRSGATSCTDMVHIIPCYFKHLRHMLADHRGSCRVILAHFSVNGIQEVDGSIPFGSTNSTPIKPGS
jgi:hypothetical protein